MLRRRVSDALLLSRGGGVSAPDGVVEVEGFGAAGTGAERPGGGSTGCVRRILSLQGLQKLGATKHSLQYFCWHSLQ